MLHNRQIGLCDLMIWRVVVVIRSLMEAHSSVKLCSVAVVKDEATAMGVWLNGSPGKVVFVNPEWVLPRDVGL